MLSKCIHMSTHSEPCVVTVLFEISMYAWRRLHAQSSADNKACKYKCLGADLVYWYHTLALPDEYQSD